jgi:hypothetical protein
MLSSLLFLHSATKLDQGIGGGYSIAALIGAAAVELTPREVKKEKDSDQREIQRSVAALRTSTEVVEQQTETRGRGKGRKRPDGGGGGKRRKIEGKGQIFYRTVSQDF